ncbi:MAG TPA: hypothetical protein VM029_09305 [Opitutaceae bacterium]|nr:hypothetical protein [Opitutaceae bacterium]
MAAYTDAFIEVSNITFLPATPGAALQLSTATFRLAQGNGVVVDNSNGTLFEVSGRARLVFYFPRQLNGNVLYSPQDLWFLQTDGVGDSNGKANLKDPKIRPYNGHPAIEIKDNLSVGYIGAKWKILIPIVRGSDQMVAVIDPEVTNTNEDSTESNPPFGRPAQGRNKPARAAKPARPAAKARGRK